MTPSRPRRRVGLGWTAIFVTVFLLSLDFWWWSGPIVFGPLNLPRWIYYFVVLQFALAGVMHLFGRAHWSDEDAPSDEEKGREG